MKKLIAATFACAALAVCADKVPAVSGITMTQSEDSRLVTIDYTLANAAAVVTLDIQTNVTGNVWASIGGENIQNVAGDVWKKIEAGARTITWRPDLSWPDHQIDNGGARAVVTAWSIDNPPDYMVVNIASNATKNSETYYPAVEFLPGGLLKNSDYRTGKLVMRKIPAKGVEWLMGSEESEPGYAESREAMHTVTLTNNYYIAVFETTQTQWGLIQPAYKNSNFTTERAMRPMEKVSYNEIRNAANSTKAETKYDYPSDPNPGSFLGLLRKKTGLAFDLPSEAQWEFACRAGHGTGYWGDGSLIRSSDKDTNLALLGRVYYNGGKILDSTGKDYIDPDASCDVTNGTAIVGSYAPNSWGLYDMHGNVWEWCLDWYADGITNLGGAVNTTEGKGRVRRGGGWRDGANYVRSASRVVATPSDRIHNFGFRLALPASPALKTE